jgi:hypothetical protein
VAATRVGGRNPPPGVGGLPRRHCRSSSQEAGDPVNAAPVPAIRRDLRRVPAVIVRTSSRIRASQPLSAVRSEHHHQRVLAGGGPAGNLGHLALEWV